MAFEGYLQVTFSKQGKSKGTSPRNAHKAKIPFIAFEYDVKSPRDVATGQMSGKRQHGTVRIIKEWDANTPMLLNALVNNERISEALFEFVRTDQKKAAEEVYFSIKLTDGTISEIVQRTGGGISGASSAKHDSRQDTMEIEVVHFTFDKIEWEHKIDKTMASDAWTTVV